MKIGKLALLFCFLASAIGCVALLAEVGMTFMGFPNGLPESVTLLMSNIAMTILGYAGACIEKRTGEANEKGSTN